MGKEAERDRPKFVYESVAVPNLFIDEIMPRVSPTNWKVLMFLWRKTIGWKQWQDYIPLSQIERGAGVSRSKALQGAKFCEKIGLFNVKPGAGRRGTTAYTVNRGFDTEKLFTVLENFTSTATSRRRPVQKMNHTSSENEPVTSSENEHSIATIESHSLKAKTSRLLFKTEKNPATVPFDELKNLAVEGYTETFGAPPSWGERDDKALREFMQYCQHTDIEEFRLRLGRYLGTEDEYFAKQLHSPAWFRWFLGNLDKFMTMPAASGRRKI